MTFSLKFICLYTSVYVSKYLYVIQKLAGNYIIKIVIATYTLLNI